MQLGDIFAKAGNTGSGVYHAPTKKIKLKVMKEIDGELFIADADAILRFVPEDAAEASRVEAEKELRKRFADGIVPTDLLVDNRAFHLLHEALRDADDPRKPFAGSVAELKGALQQRVGMEAFDAYQTWVREEFPPHVDDETFAELVAAASKKSLPDLLSQFDSSEISRAWPSLVAHFGKSQTPTSGAGEPG